MRLVDAEMYCTELYNEMNYPGRSEEFMTAIDVAIADLADAPTVDAVPVRHGHWETNSDRPDSLICSVCKCGFDMWKHDPHNFCPNCGSKMNGGKNDAVD